VIDLSMDDIDCWDQIDPADLWVTDKMLLAKRLGYICGPAGLPPPSPGSYVVRPCVNYRMMGRSARVMYLTPDDHAVVPDGYFWCEVFKGRHLSFDFHNGEQVLAVEGFRDDKLRLDRFSKWQKVNDRATVPDLLKSLIFKYEWVNIETIGNKVIEVHFRNNDDFADHNSNEIIPVWKDQFHVSECGDRIGFILK